MKGSLLLRKDPDYPEGVSDLPHKIILSVLEEISPRNFKNKLMKIRMLRKSFISLTLVLSHPVQLKRPGQRHC